MQQPELEPVITIDPDTRVVTVPKELYNIAPSQDTNCIYRRKIFQNYNHPNILLFDELKEKYYSIGYNQFKISGRGGPPNGINQVCSITPYLFKPDYQIEAINFLMS